MMQEFKFGSIFKDLRVKRGLTQSIVANGICTHASQLSDFENGIYCPDWSIFERLMQRLGEDPLPYYPDFMSQETHRVMNFKQTMKYNLHMKKKHESYALLEQAENDDAFKEGNARQFVLSSKAHLYFLGKDYDNAYVYAMKSIRITIPYYHEDEIAKYPLTLDEMVVIQLLALIYSITDSHEKSLDILLKLKESFYRNKYPFDTMESVRLEVSILYNIAKRLAVLGKTEEWLSICDEGIEFCREKEISHYMPLFLVTKAYYFLYLKKNDEGMILITDAINTFKVFGRTKEILKLKKNMKKNFGIEINYNV